MLLLNIFILSAFVGYFSISNITQTLHSPLMSLTNAISGIIIIGALNLLNPPLPLIYQILLYLAIFFASINIFGGFYITYKMLHLFKPKDKKND